MEKIQVKIVPMNADHLDEIAALERVCFSRPWSRNMLAEELENQCAAFLTALDAVTGKVVGYAGLLVAADEGYITNVAVFPEYRRQGIAAKLLKLSLIHILLSAERTKTATGSSGGFQRITGSSRFGGTALLRDRPALLLSCQGPAAVGKYTM